MKIIPEILAHIKKMYYLCSARMRGTKDKKFNNQKQQHIMETPILNTQSIEKSIENYNNAKKAVYADCTKFIKDTVSAMPEGELPIPCELMDRLYVSYDGGNHPEYASNCYSEVSSIYIKDGDIYLDIDETAYYPLDNVPVEEVVNIAEFISANFTDIIDLINEEDE